MGEDGFLRIKLSGDLDGSVIENFRQDYIPFLDASTDENPLNSMVDAHQIGKISSTARKFFTNLNHDPRYGLVALIGAPRAARVLGKFILKATNRDNINFFDNEEDAVIWLKSRA
jgi:hypothetical protein